MTASPDDALIAAARGGDAAAFAVLCERAAKRLRAVVRRLVGHPDDVDDIVQSTLMKGWDAIGGYRGDAAFTTWLCAIGTRLALDHLRKEKRWREQAQVAYANACLADPALGLEVAETAARQDVIYDVKEHIGYCLTCVGRSLPPEQHAAFTMRAVLGHSNREAAQALDITESVLRHHVAAARETMGQAFDGLCALVNKNGVCYQCKGLRELFPEDRKGSAVPAISSLDQRCRMAATAELDEGSTQQLHDVFWRRTKVIENSADGEAVSATDCGRDAESVDR